LSSRAIQRISRPLPHDRDAIAIACHVNAMPLHDTFSEVFARLDSLQFYAALQSWTT